MSLEHQGENTSRNDEDEDDGEQMLNLTLNGDLLITRDIQQSHDRHERRDESDEAQHPSPTEARDGGGEQGEECQNQDAVAPPPVSSVKAPRVVLGEIRDEVGDQQQVDEREQFPALGIGGQQRCLRVIDDDGQ